MEMSSVMPAWRGGALALVGMIIILAVLLRPAVAAPTSTAAPPEASAASTQSAPPVIRDLTPWLGKNKKPTLAAWDHAAHFSISYEISPQHNTPAPAATQVDAGYTADALWLRFEAQDPHPAGIGAR